MIVELLVGSNLDGIGIFGGDPSGIAVIELDFDPVIAFFQEVEFGATVEWFGKAFGVVEAVALAGSYRFGGDDSLDIGIEKVVFVEDGTGKDAGEEKG